MFVVIVVASSLVLVWLVHSPAILVAVTALVPPDRLPGRFVFRLARLAFPGSVDVVVVDTVSIVRIVVVVIALVLSDLFPGSWGNPEQLAVIPGKV